MKQAAKRKPADGAKQVQRVRDICLALPEAWEKISHGEPTWFVGKKVFAMFSNNHHHDGHVAVTVPAAIGISGLVKRDTLPDADIGFAFLPQHWNQGYAIESARAVMEHARNVLGVNRVVAITSQGNEASAKLLEKIGLRFQRLIQLSDNAPEVKLFTPD